MREQFLARGMVLVVVMLFLSVISLLALKLLDISILETKMNSYHQDRIQAFYRAENLLLQYEQDVSMGKKVITASIMDQANIYGATFYRVIASAEYHGVLSKLQSIFVTINQADDCNPKPNIAAGRQSFLVLD